MSNLPKIKEKLGKRFGLRDGGSCGRSGRSEWERIAGPVVHRFAEGMRGRSGRSKWEPTDGPVVHWLAEGVRSHPGDLEIGLASNSTEIYAVLLPGRQSKRPNTRLRSVVHEV